ncbi:MAG: alpha/beta hydrolase [Planctomycetota bacterium]
MASVDEAPWWLTMAHWGVVGLYTLGPLVLIVIGLRRKAWRSRVIATCVSGAIIGFGLVVGYALLVAGDVTAIRPGVAVVTAWLAIGLLGVLKGIDLLITFGTQRLATIVAEGRGRYPRRSIFAVARGIRLVLMLVIGLPILASAAMVYRPATSAQALPGGTSVEVQFETTDGLTIAGLFLPSLSRQTSSEVVLVVPGLGSGKADALPSAEAIRSVGYDVLIIDPRAHGDSDGRLSTFGDRERLDVLAAVDWIRRQGDEPVRVYGLGMSMGGAAVLGAAADDAGFEAVAIIDSFDDLPQLVDSIVGRQFRLVPPLRALTESVAIPLLSVHSGRPLWRHKPADDVQTLWPTPVLIVHSFRDEIIPFVRGRALYEAAAEPRRSFWLEEESHAETVTSPAAIDAVIRFFRDASVLPTLASAG